MLLVPARNEMEARALSLPGLVGTGSRAGGGHVSLPALPCGDRGQGPCVPSSVAAAEVL